MRFWVGLLLFGIVAGAEPEREWILTPKGNSRSRQSLQARLPRGSQLIRRFGPDGRHRLYRLPAKAAVPRGDFKVQPNFAYSELGSDPDLSRSWGLANRGQTIGSLGVGIAGVDVDAIRAWKISEGAKKVIVAVLDSGIALGHEDLKTGLWKNLSEIDGNGRDDDGNGYVDDRDGWDFVGGSARVEDKRGHGTFCAGIIAADRENGKGSRGIAPGGSLMPLKMIADDGIGTTASAVEAIDYAVANGARVLSLSWGGRESDPILFEALKRASDAGVLIIAAAGNDGVNNDRDFKPIYPASYDLPTLISVAAYDNRDELADFSNYGKTSVDLGAPGVEIYSTGLTGYGFKKGTSFAAPFVAGAAALVLAVNPELNGVQVKDRILRSTTQISYYERWRTSTGGRLNIFQAVSGIFPERITEPVRWRRFPIQFATPHPYTNNSKLNFEIRHPGAKNIRLHFTKFDVEPDFDTLTLRDGAGKKVFAHSGNLGESLSADAQGEVISLEFESDFVRTAYGFEIDAYEIAE